ncbi:MAG: VWA domain-containing protein [Candidatus Nanohaloarchaea archaeon]|nr:VWA domain-containing protein [Candidatus Nanohaloarchaea archaeon]
MMVGVQRPLALLLLLPVLPVLYSAVHREDRFRQVTTLLRAALLVLLVGAVAGPTVTTQQPVHSQPRLTVLVDQSMSTSVLEQPSLQFDGVEVRRRTIAAGNTSDLKQGILRHLEPDTNYVAVSDFQTSGTLDGVAERFNAVNSTLNVLNPASEHEAAVRIEGPDTTVPGAETRFTVHVSATGSVPTPQVQVDGETVKPQKSGKGAWTFTRSFETEGSHRVTASIPASDRYDVNDQYFKAVEVAEKPEVLVVGKRGGMGAALERFYDVTYRSEPPEDLEEYYAVVLKKDVDGMERYAMQGNGVVYTGDPSDAAMDILPVRTTADGRQSEGTKIVLAVDISVSTAEEGKVKRSKQIAYNLVELLPFNNRAGAVAYNRDAYLVSRPQPLSLHRDRLKQKIARLQPSGPSFHNAGLKGAAELLNSTGNIIWITDGKIGGLGANEQVPARTRQVAQNLDVRLITVAVGGDANTEFLRQVTDTANGMFLDASEAGRLQFVFAAGGAAGKASRLVVVDPSHFITQREELSAAATGFDPVTPRRGADLLVTGTGGQPFLTAWRYGLGRVAAFSGGNRELTQLRRDDPSLLLRTVSWAVGEPDRKEDRWVDIENGHVGSPVQVRASHPVDGLKRQSSSLYTGELEPGRSGFHTFAGKTYAYNYNPELSRVGYRSVEGLARQTGGEVFQPDETAAIREQARQFSTRTVPTKTPVTNYLLVAALAVFLGEVGYRKMNGRL